MDNRREEIARLAAPLLERCNLELVDLEFVRERGRWILRFFIDKPGGVTLDDCEEFSRLVGDLLDIHDPIPQSYILEVSSPGVERPLKKKEDFARFLHHAVRIKTYAPVEGRKNFSGTLISVEGEAVILLDAEQRETAIPLEQIARANLVYEPRT